MNLSARSAQQASGPGDVPVQSGMDWVLAQQCAAEPVACVCMLPHTTVTWPHHKGRCQWVRRTSKVETAGNAEWEKVEVRRPRRRYSPRAWSVPSLPPRALSVDARPCHIYTGVTVDMHRPQGSRLLGSGLRQAARLPVSLVATAQQ